MGSVVKSIGKVFKKIGKGLKKIAPILLVAAAAYVGYGYATGWQGAGWPRITEWGKSLMNGVRQGVSLSESSVQASQEFANPTYQNQMGLPEVPTSAVATAVPSGPDVVGEVIDDTINIGPNVEPFNPITTQSGAPVTSNTTFLGSSAQPVSPITTQSGSGLGLLGETPTISPSGEYTAMGPTAGLLSNETSTDTVELLTGENVIGNDPSIAASAASDIPASESTADAASIDKSLRTYYQDPFAFEDAKASTSVKSYKDASETWDFLKDKIPTELMGKAWGFYKELWKNDPLVALYGTQKVLEMILTYLDKEDEKESYQKRHVAGMPPRSMSDVMKTHQKATAAGLRHDKTGIWAQSARPSSGMQGPVNPVRVSAINKQPPGLLGRNPQRALS